MNKHKVKRHRNSDTKLGKREPQQNNPLGSVSNELLGGGGGGGGLKLVLRAQPSVSEVVKAFSWLLGRMVTHSSLRFDVPLINLLSRNKVIVIHAVCHVLTLYL